MSQDITIEYRPHPNCQALMGLTHFHESGGNIYVSVGGYVTPCCWYGEREELENLWDKSQINKEWHNIHHHSIQEILNGPMFKWIEEHMSEVELCHEHCPRNKKDHILPQVSKGDII